MCWCRCLQGSCSSCLLVVVLKGMASDMNTSSRDLQEVADCVKCVCKAARERGRAEEGSSTEFVSSGGISESSRDDRRKTLSVRVWETSYNSV